MSSRDFAQALIALGNVALTVLNLAVLTSLQRQACKPLGHQKNSKSGIDGSSNLSHGLPNC